MRANFFGHDQGRPLPARLKTGLAASRQPRRGTLFLDEVGEIPLELQSKTAARSAGEILRTSRRGENPARGCADRCSLPIGI